MVDTEDLFSEWFSLNNEEEAYSSELERLEFNKMTILGGSGFLIPMITLGVLAVVLSMFLVHPAKKFSPIAAAKQKIDNIFRWNYTLRLLYETSLDISILAMVETYVLNFDTLGYKISFGIAIIMMAALLSLALFIRFYVRRIDM